MASVPGARPFPPGRGLLLPSGPNRGALASFRAHHHHPCCPAGKGAAGGRLERRPSRLFHPAGLMGGGGGGEETEAGAMKEETAVRLYEMERPRSSREKFIQAWNEKLKHQPRPTLSSEVPEPATGIPIQSKEIGDEKHPSHLLSRASLGAEENAVYFMTMSDPPPSQLHTSSGDVQAPELCPRELPAAAAACSDLETSNEEEFLETCASDVSLKSPERKRPRLPPQNKMHMEVQKKQASDLPEESPRSPGPLGYSPLENTMRMTTPDNPHEVESMHPRSSPKQKPHSFSSSDRPVCPPARYPSPSDDTEASPCPQPANIGHKEHQRLNQERSTPPSHPVTATQGCLGLLPISCLPPKKRYTRKLCL